MDRNQQERDRQQQQDRERQRERQRDIDRRWEAVRSSEPNNPRGKG